MGGEFNLFPSDFREGFNDFPGDFRKAQAGPSLEGQGERREAYSASVLRYSKMVRFNKTSSVLMSGSPCVAAYLAIVVVVAADAVVDVVVVVPVFVVVDVAAVV